MKVWKNVLFGVLAIALFTGATCTWRIPPNSVCVEAADGGWDCAWEIDPL